MPFNFDINVGGVNTLKVIVSGDRVSYSWSCTALTDLALYKQSLYIIPSFVTKRSKSFGSFDPPKPFKRPKGTFVPLWNPLQKGKTYAFGRSTANRTLSASFRRVHEVCRKRSFQRTYVMFEAAPLGDKQGVIPLFAFWYFVAIQSTDTL